MVQNRAEEIESKVDQFQDKVMTSSLNKLLAWDGNLISHDEMSLPALKSGRPAIQLEVRAISNQQMESIRKQATSKPSKTQRRMGVTEGELNLVRQRRLIIFTGVIEPDLSDSDLQDRFNRGSRDFTAIVDNLFLLGEQIDISDKIMELSGINDDDVDSEETLGENTFLPE